ncbi:diacylglycerol/lipid kinase family protein [Peptostreptococcus faecalis]|uniref:diacylglycerol/lipid kinase family protein n=1 Tax=Peptostreptococcus faecalis TaxID=2045015 RepID=UPI000C7E7F69|nr:diacylglycerol kinase family protein [Peptostreptococcus faecalis]
MKKAMIIINPTAGMNQGELFINKIDKKFKKHFDVVDIRITKKEKDAIKFSQEAAKEKYECVFAAGGDGTVNEIISGIAEQNYRPKFGIIPLGTVNALARLIGISMDIDVSIENIDFEKTRQIDIGKANDKYFGNIFSMGSISKAIHEVDTDKKAKFGPLAYLTMTLKRVLNDDVHRIKVETENGDYIGNASHVIVLLSDYFGDIKLVGGNDNGGYANIMILVDSKLISKINLIPYIIKGSVEESDKVIRIRAKNIKITSEEKNIETDLDGDRGDYLPVEIEILPNHLKIYC